MEGQEASVSTRVEEQEASVSIMVEENFSEKVDDKSSVKLQFKGDQTETRVKLEVEEADNLLDHQETQKETDKLDAPPPLDVPPRPDIPPLPVGIAEQLGLLAVDETPPNYSSAFEYRMRQPIEDPYCPLWLCGLCGCDPETSEVLCCCCELCAVLCCDCCDFCCYREPGDRLEVEEADDILDHQETQKETDKDDAPEENDDEDDDDDGGYYIPFRKLEELMPESCLFDSLERSEANRLLKEKDRDGTYLIRAGSHVSAGKILSVWHIDRCRHYKLFKDENSSYSLNQGQAFRNIPELLQYYTLQSHLPRSDFYLGEPFNPNDY